ncbi:UNVERIFIED_CONTAM: hypothetical protein FKN15_005156 [Acipenser sinensis]
MCSPRSRSQSPQARRVKCSKQARDIIDLKAQMVQVLELLSKQAAVAPAAVPAPIQPQLPYPPSPRGHQGGWEEVSQLAQEDMLSIVTSGDGASCSSDMQVGGEPEPPAEEEPSFEVALEASGPPLLNSALMGHAAAFLQVPGRQLQKAEESADPAKFDLLWREVRYRARISISINWQIPVRRLQQLLDGQRLAAKAKFDLLESAEWKKVLLQGQCMEKGVETDVLGEAKVQGKYSSSRYWLMRVTPFVVPTGQKGAFISEN